MKTASAKSKGRTLQQWVAKLILKCFPSLTEHDVRSTSMGVSGVDVQLSTEALKLFPYSVECKSYASIAVYKWYDQAKTNTIKGTEPLLVIKANRQKPLVVVDAEYFFERIK